MQGKMQNPKITIPSSLMNTYKTILHSNLTKMLKKQKTKSEYSG